MASSPLLASSPALPCRPEESSLFCPTPALCSTTHACTKSSSTQHHSGDDLALTFKSEVDELYHDRRGSMTQGLHQFLECAQGKHGSEDLNRRVPMDTLSPTYDNSFASSRSIRSSPPCTPSTNLRVNTTRGNPPMYNPAPPSHPVTHLTASPLVPPATPYYMDISPISLNIASSHFATGPVEVPSGGHYQSLCEDDPIITFPTDSRRNYQDHRPLEGPQVGEMDIDSPGYNKVSHILNNTEPGVQSAPASPSRHCISPLKQHSSGSASEGGVGKRNRMEEDEGHKPSSSFPTSGRSSRRHRLSRPSIHKSVTSNISPSMQGSGSKFALQTMASDLNMHLISPEPLCSSPVEDVSPCLNVFGRKALFQAATASPNPVFRFPVTKPTFNCEKPPSIIRKPRSSTVSIRSDSVPCRSKSKVAQNTATLFNRHLSLSTSLDITRLEGTTDPRQESGSQVDEREVSEDPEDSFEFELSPVISVKKISTRNTNSKGKRCAAPLALDHLQPPPSSTGASLSPSHRLGFTFSSTIQSPVGIAFSEKERAGKILPCHKVSSDGLMRISPETMDRLLEGAYDDQISTKMIIDCRFGYEYDGGHIREAINVHDKEAAEQMLLQGALFKGGHRDVPIPSESGKPDPNGETKKVLLVFHCEYSAMRAPTVAKYLREQDRHMNMTHYPALHYPEIYILEGGFAKFFAHSPHHCNGTYVRMDDPTYRTDRQTDLNLFRNRESVFTRTKSYTYGEIKTNKQKKDPKLTLGGPRFGVDKRSTRLYHETKENNPAHCNIVEEEDDDENENYGLASSPLYMTITAANHAKRANLKNQGRSVSMLASVEQGRNSVEDVGSRKAFGNRTQLNRLALA
ncbi:hypothetical protein PCANC_04808 [Puccinia coronata f. sp. avenae]|uniref:M-phase inducer phosphatase n=1 Tax=Puccinia coronata f. sp. avenae TaxID=200324 RepID=A0A2N5W2N6_9BASI|nr:hypothetical protein PCANC_04808 [Puccinia coronata f. sp. avenae]